jgi:hypothetical protein
MEAIYSFEMLATFSGLHGVYHSATWTVGSIFWSQVPSEWVSLCDQRIGACGLPPCYMNSIINFLTILIHSSKSVTVFSPFLRTVWKKERHSYFMRDGDKGQTASYLINLSDKLQNVACKFFRLKISVIFVFREICVLKCMKIISTQWMNLSATFVKQLIYQTYWTRTSVGLFEGLEGCLKVEMTI